MIETYKGARFNILINKFFVVEWYCQVGIGIFVGLHIYAALLTFVVNVHHCLGDVAFEAETPTEEGLNEQEPQKTTDYENWVV